jgi:hypothetical protein
MSYMVDKSPAVDPLLQRQVREWEPKEHRPTLTWSRSGYKPYSTYVCPIHHLTRAKSMQGQEQVRAMGAGSEGATVDFTPNHFLAITVYNKDSVRVSNAVTSALCLFSVPTAPLCSNLPVWCHVPMRCCARS